jgi:hypothetical protein
MPQEYTKQEISYPEVKTYWIFWVNKTDDFSYGVTETNQVTSGYKPYAWTTLDEDEWVAKLKTEFNTDPFPPEEEEEITI